MDDFIIENIKKFKFDEGSLWEVVEETLDDGSTLKKDILITTKYEFKEKCWIVPWISLLNLPDLIEKMCFHKWVYDSLPDGTVSIAELPGIIFIDDKIYRFSKDNSNDDFDSLWYVEKTDKDIKFKLVLTKDEYLQYKKENTARTAFATSPEKLLDACDIYWPLEEENKNE